MRKRIVMLMVATLCTIGSGITAVYKAVEDTTEKV